MARAFLRELKNSNHSNHMRPADGGAFTLPSSSSAQRLLHATIFPSAETVHRTSVRMRFIRTLIVRRCVVQRQPNRRAPVENSASATDEDDNRTAFARRPRHNLLIWGGRVHVRLSSNNGLSPDIAPCRFCAKLRHAGRSARNFRADQPYEIVGPQIGCRVLDLCTRFRAEIGDLVSFGVIDSARRSGDHS
jgi:hypothetical protein